MNIRKRIDEVYDEAVEIRRCFHENPELSEHEVETARTISEFLKENGIEHETGVAGHGIVAIVRGKRQPKVNQKFLTVGLRGDIDALPIAEGNDFSFKSKNKGVMHACGHDIHGAVLLGAAKIFKEMEDELAGNVKFFFEPAEETVGGAEEMIRRGCLENPHVDAVLGIHIAPDVQAGKVQFRRGKMNAASTEFEITVEGVFCHGAHPENGVDSIVTMSHIICALQSIITRNLSPTNPGVITVGRIEGGSKNNVLAKETFVEGIIRALDNDTREYIKAGVLRMTESVAAGFGAKVKVDFADSYPALENDDEVCGILEKTAEKILSKDNVCFLPEPSLGADDFSYFTQAAKGVYFNLGCRSKAETKPQMLHSEFLNPDEECIRVGLLMEVFGTLALLEEEN